MHTLAHTTIHPYPRTVTCTPTCTRTRPRLTLPCLLNIGTKENICILSRPASFDCSSAAVGNNAQALLIHQGEREFLLEESSKEPPARLFTAWLADWLIDWMTGYAILTAGSASCLTRLLFTARTLTCWHVQYIVQQERQRDGFLRNTSFHTVCWRFCFTQVSVSCMKMKQVHDVCDGCPPLLQRIHTPVTFDWW